MTVCGSGEGSGDTQTVPSITGNYSTLQLHRTEHARNGWCCPGHHISLYSRPAWELLFSSPNLFYPVRIFNKIWTLYLKLFHTTPIIYRTFFSGKFSRSHSVTPLCPGYFKLYFIPHLSRLENVTSPGQAGYKIGWIFFEWWISWYIILFLIILLIISL